MIAHELGHYKRAFEDSDLEQVRNEINADLIAVSFGLIEPLIEGLAILLETRNCGEGVKNK